MGEHAEVVVRTCPFVRERVAQLGFESLHEHALVLAPLHCQRLVTTALNTIQVHNTSSEMERETPVSAAGEEIIRGTASSACRIYVLLGVD
jgi:hypothetical protein